MRPTALALPLAACLAGCATAPTAGAPADPDAPRAAARLAWDERAGSIRCPGGASVAVPDELARNLRPDGADGLAIVPPGPAPGGALVATTLDPSGPPRTGSGGALPPTWARLHKLASGKEPGPVHADMRIVDASVVVADYAENDAPEVRWRFVYADTGQCRIAALDRVRPDAPPRFTPLVSGMFIPPRFMQGR